MDRQPAPPPFQRPPDRHMIQNPNYQPPTTQAYNGYPPSTSQPQQPQQPVHAPFAADPYSIPRRDPFYPAASQHARHRSQGALGGNNAPQQGQAEGQSGWADTGTAAFHLEHTCANI